MIRVSIENVVSSLPQMASTFSLCGPAGQATLVASATTSNKSAVAD